MISNDLFTLTQDVTRCFKCDIGEDTDSRGYRVIYRGHHKPKHLFIGEAPGEMEEKLGRPFVGRAGAVLQNILNELEITDYGITNIIRCRPTKLISATKLGNRRPTPEEIIKCLPFLERTIKILNPHVLIAMGKTAIETLIHGTIPTVNFVRGSWFKLTLGDTQYPVLATYHPAAVLYNNLLLDALKQDISTVDNPQVIYNDKAMM